MQALMPKFRPFDRAVSVGFALALSTAAAGLFPAAAAAQGGPEETAKFLKTVDATNRGIREARDQVQKTIGVYNSIIELTAKDTKGAYKDLGKQTADCEKKVADLGPRVDEMKAGALSYFDAWKAATAAITDPDLRKRAEKRLADSQARYDDIAAAGRDARSRFDSLMTEIRDQSVFLGHDLNPSAISSLKPDAAKLNDHGKAALAKIDAVAKLYDDYAASMKP
jgi:hypothetical protein